MNLHNIFSLILNIKEKYCAVKTDTYQSKNERKNKLWANQLLRFVLYKT